MPEIEEHKDQEIHIQGARVHNLKNLNVDIPRDKLIVVTGLSGSGKSSLAFDTLYAEGQRRYVESLSSYARQFLGRLDKPDVDRISGIPPAIAIEQKVNTRNPRSTVGTSTEIYDYLKLLFARIGETYSPVSGMKVVRHQVQDVVSFVCELGKGIPVMVLSPLHNPSDRSMNQHLEVLLKQGFTRVEEEGEIRKISDIIGGQAPLCENCNIKILVDRFIVDPDDEDFLTRVADSTQTAFFEGKGECILKAIFDGKTVEYSFSERFELDGIRFEYPTEHLFSFNNPLGACPKCEGFGNTIGIDEDLVVPNKNLSIYQDAIVCWKGEKMSQWKDLLILHAEKFDFPVHKPYYQLSDEQRSLLWSGNQYFDGLDSFFKHLEEKAYKIQYRVMLARYRGKTTCPECKGKRLRKEAGWVKIGGKSLSDLVELPIKELQQFFYGLTLSDYQQKVADRLLKEISNRIQYLNEVGLEYLTLNRASNSLSGGESQRINLASSLGSSLVGSLYILDEPSIGLHPRDTQKLIGVLRKLRDLGNTVMVVEHDEEIIRSADFVIDIGPFAGRLGGELVFAGSKEELLEHKKSLTAKYLRGEEQVPVPDKRRKWNNFIEVKGATENNLKGFDVKFPLGILTIVTGVSGSGKSTLVHTTLYNGLAKRYSGSGERVGRHSAIEGDFHLIRQVELIDQNPIGKSSRSNPVTYIKAYDEIRKLMSELPYSKMNGFKPSHFSFNVEGGRCEECQGEGVIRVEMQFMADVILTCDHCHGARFKEEILDVRFKEKNIDDILNLTVDEAIEFFGHQKESASKKVATRLQPLADVGLGYIKLGQSSSTLSGGESQRVKLASFLSRGNDAGHTLFIFDEPTTGLHFHDIRVLMGAFNALLEKGHTLIVIEHNPEVMKQADWMIDLGPVGGSNGGHIVFEGSPEDIMQCHASYTGRHLSQSVRTEDT